MNTKRTQCTATIESNDEGELIMVFPDHLITELGWNPNDTLVWTIQDNGNILLTKQD